MAKSHVQNNFVDHRILLNLSLCEADYLRDFLKHPIDGEKKLGKQCRVALWSELDKCLAPLGYDPYNEGNQDD